MLNAKRRLLQIDQLFFHSFLPLKIYAGRRRQVAPSSRLGEFALSRRRPHSRSLDPGNFENSMLFLFNNSSKIEHPTPSRHARPPTPPMSPSCFFSSFFFSPRRSEFPWNGTFNYRHRAGRLTLMEADGSRDDNVETQTGPAGSRLFWFRITKT